MADCFVLGAINTTHAPLPEVCHSTGEKIPLFLFAMFDYSELLSIRDRPPAIVSLLRQHKLLLSTHDPCPYCETPLIRKHDRHLPEGQRLHCRTCDKNFSVYSYSIFSHTHLTLFEFSQLLCFFDSQLTVTQASKVSGLRMATVSEIYNKIRHTLKAYNEQHPIIWPKDEIVEFDETIVQALRDVPHFGSDSRGDPDERVEGWVIGGVGRNTGLVHLEPITDRRAETLLAIVNKHVPEHCRVTTDQHASYGNLMRTHEYAPTFKYHVGSATYPMPYREPSARFGSWTVHTNTIEGQWSLLKSHFHISHGWPASYVPCVLAEFIYRSRHISLSVALQAK